MPEHGHVNLDAPAVDPQRLRAAADRLRARLLERRTNGHWIGELSASPLSTATAVSALCLAARDDPDTSTSLQRLAQCGLDWLTGQQNHDGGWGDTDRSHSNIATTMLVLAAFHLAGQAESRAGCLDRARRYVARQGGIPGLKRRYGRDRTFAAPILTNMALAGLVDWRDVPPLPFELACAPQWVYRFLRLPVVSYAIPALVAIGQARFVHRKPRNPLSLLARRAAAGRSLNVIRHIQPASGGYLEATPLTSFVVMSLASIGHSAHPVVRDGLRFLIDSVRADGSWPIDTNLATWNTTLAIGALPDDDETLRDPRLLEWLLDCQHVEPHPFTGAAAGGWAWTDLSGGVPDADDTAGALLALHRLSIGADPDTAQRAQRAAVAGIQWLLDLQNRDGGWPTFCRGWGTLPFDRSGTDLTAHAMRAIHVWRNRWTASGGDNRTLHRIRRAMARGWRRLAARQRSDGSWVPLWFGDQDDPNEENPVYGTSRVLLAYRDLDSMSDPEARRGVSFLCRRQNPDGGWGGGPVPHSSVEQTALAVESLLAAPADPQLQGVFNKGLNWLVEAVEAGRAEEASPIGFYFARLWYYEHLYPLVFATSALGRSVRRLPPQPASKSLASDAAMS